MAANTSPIFVGKPNISFASLSTSAVTGTDGTDANVRTIFTADATNGSKIETVFIRHSGTNSSATVVRFWLNNGSSAGTATNNSLIWEETLALNTLSQTAASVPVTWQANLYLKPGYKLLAASGTAIAGGVQVTAQGGDFTI